MAIYGTTKILKAQTQGEKLQKALDFLTNTNLAEVFSSVSPGNNKTIEIDGKNIFAIFQAYTSKLPVDAKIEGHYKYIDIQYIFEGSERILMATEKDISEKDEYNEERDLHFPKCNEYSILELRKDEAVILWPEDLHGPGCCVEKPAPVKKIVIKVAV